MHQFASTRVSNFVHAVWIDMLIAFITLLAAVVATFLDKDYITPKVGPEISVLIYFLLVLAVIVLGIYIFSFIYSALFRKNIRIKIELSTKPGRKCLGRFLGVFIHNKSAGEIELDSVIIQDMKRLDGNWIPNERFKVHDPLLWGAETKKTGGRVLVKKEKSAIADILRTSDKNNGGLLYLQQVSTREAVTAPVGSYKINLEINGSHLGEPFNIPFCFNVSFDGGMRISKIKSKGKRDKRIGDVELYFDGKVTNL